MCRMGQRGEGGGRHADRDAFLDPFDTSVVEGLVPSLTMLCRLCT